LEILLQGASNEEKISENTAGFGLGLFISNKIAEKLSKSKVNLRIGISWESKVLKVNIF
jgi:hypothetical protein